MDLAVGQSLLSGYLLALARTAGFILITPPFNLRGIPRQARASVAIALAVPLSTWTQETAPSFGSDDFLLRMIVQIVTGITLGMFVFFAVAAIQLVGDIIDVVGGFSMTLGMDPLLQQQTSVMGRLHQLVATTLLFVGDGHLMILQGLSRSLQLMPVPELTLEAIARALMADLTGMFLAAMQIVAPIVAALLVADVALGLLTKAAPALNAFQLAFPLKILLSLLLIGLVLTQIPNALEQQVRGAIESILRLSGG